MIGELRREDAPADDRRYRLVAGAARVERASATVLVAPKTGRAVRTTKVADDLMPLLMEGASFEQLSARLEERNPTARDVPVKLHRFLDQLEGIGLIEGAKANRTGPERLLKVELFQPDAAAAAVARAIRAVPAWLAWSLLALVALAAVAGFVALIVTGRMPHPRALFTQLDFVGFIVFALLVAPVHEAAHAIACRLAGVRVGAAGLALHGMIPGPYVDTGHSYEVPEKWKRFWIPAAGPLINLCAAGAAAWAIVFSPSDGWTHAFAYLFLFCVAFVYLDTNPLTPSDGSHMIEALLDDEFAYEAAVRTRYRQMSGWKTVATYRAVTAVHVQVFALLLWFWWTHVVPV